MHKEITLRFLTFFMNNVFSHSTDIIWYYFVTCSSLLCIISFDTVI